MKQIFIDTSGWLALLNVSDINYKNATEVYQSKKFQGIKFLTHQAILLEVGNGLSNVKMRSVVIGLKNKLEKSNIVDIIEFNQELYNAGWQLFEERADKNWGIVDCISFVVMRQNKISEALTADKHFGQAGFTKLL